MNTPGGGVKIRTPKLLELKRKKKLENFLFFFLPKSEIFDVTKRNSTQSEIIATSKSFFFMFFRFEKRKLPRKIRLKVVLE